MTLAFIFIGTIIGAGFVSGQEIKSYFVDFGIYGFLGLILFFTLFFYVSRKIMLMGYYSKAISYEKILTYGFVCKFRKIIDYILCFCLIGTASTMFSGMGTFLFETFNIPVALGSLIMGISVFFITILGIKSIMKVSSFIIPLLIFFTLMVCINSFNYIDFEGLNYTISKLCSPKYIVSSVIYCAYNIVMALSILPILGGKCKNSKEVKKIAFFSSLVIGIFAITIYFALLLNYDKIMFSEIPIATLASSKYHTLYGVSFMIATLTTAIGCLYGVYERIYENKIKLIYIFVISYSISLMGFSNLVSKLYYLIGIFGVVIIYMLIRGFNRYLKHNKYFL